jgi:hypothetical protein
MPLIIEGQTDREDAAIAVGKRNRTGENERVCGWVWEAGSEEQEDGGGNAGDFMQVDWNKEQGGTWKGDDKVLKPEGLQTAVAKFSVQRAF